MLGMTIRIIIVLLFMAGLGLLVSGKTRYGGKVVISDAIGITAFFALIEVFCANIGIVGNSEWILLAEFAVVILSAAIVICAIWGYLKLKTVWISLVTALVLCCVIVGVYHVCSLAFKEIVYTN